MANTYPEPLSIPPLFIHRQTFILLHGRGGNAEIFGPDLLDTILPTGQKFHQALPYTKFIFPIAPKGRAACFNRSVINQWFDNVSPLTMESSGTREYLMSAGLKQTTLFLHQVMRSECEIVGAENVILGGLSQGCAASLIALLTWKGPPLGGYVGMCGWLPLARHLVEITAPAGSFDEKGNDIGNDGICFARDDQAWEVHGDKQNYANSPASQALAILRDELELPAPSASQFLIYPPSKPSSLHTPIFLAHGIQDEKVPIELGRQARDCLRALGSQDMEWFEEERLGHWYSALILGRVVNFLEGKTENEGIG